MSWRIAVLVFVIAVACWVTIWLAHVPVAVAAATGAIGFVFGFLLGLLEPRQVLLRALIPFTIPAVFILLIGVGGLIRGSAIMWLLLAAVAVEFGRAARRRLRRARSGADDER
ncbi:hypothetical protein DEI91_04845 [Curtobacterium sp. MCBD17_032]|nr:hypothetical protein DEI91_04845 [Curtobacterium sp. MCBD17_032]